jgi:hypothetical protein
MAMVAATANSIPIAYRQYAGEAQLAHIAALVESELSEPYVVYTYRYFLHQWSVSKSLATLLSSLEQDSQERRVDRACVP